MEDHKRLAHHTYLRLGVCVWNEICEADQTIHDHHNHSLVKVLNRVETLVFHAERVARDNRTENYIEDKTRYLVKQDFPTKNAQHTNHKPSQQEVPVVYDEPAIISSQTFPHRLESLLKVLVARLNLVIILPANI